MSRILRLRDDGIDRIFECSVCGHAVFPSSITLEDPIALPAPERTVAPLPRLVEPLEPCGHQEGVVMVTSHGGR